MLTDLDWPALQRYESAVRAPEDFDAFWSATLEQHGSGPLDVRTTRVESPVRTVELHDLTFRGFGGDPVRAWLRVPRERRGPLPAIVQYQGYGGGRGRAEEDLLPASCGYAHLLMDTRGQGAGWSGGDTADPHGSGPQGPGMLTKGIRSRDTYYYRRLFVDAVRAVDAAGQLDVVDPDRVGVMGGSQGGGLALAAAALSPRVRAAAVWVPFLCDFPRALDIAAADPYAELTRYLAAQRDHVDEVLGVLRYFDGVNLARRATAPARFSVALMDPVCPPSTVLGAYRAYGGEASLDVWRFNQHEGGGFDDRLAALRHFATHFAP